MADNKSTYRIDWALLLFLIGLTNVKLYIKIAAVVFYLVYVLVKKYPLLKPNRLNKFYIYIVLLALVTFFVNGAYNIGDYRVGFSIGLAQWMVAMLASYLLYITTSIKSQQEITKVVKAYFALNAIISIGAIIFIFVDLGFKMPYWSHSFKYGVSTGDYVNGVLNDSSVVNAAVSTLGAIYFLRTKEFRWALLCLIVMLLCTSNLTLILFLLLLLLVVVATKDVAVRRNGVFLLIIAVFTYPILSPQNLKYISVVYKRKVTENYTLKLETIPELNKEIKLFKEPEGTQGDDEFGRIRGKDIRAVTKANTFYAIAEEKDNPIFNKHEYEDNIGKYKAKLKSTLLNVSGEVDAIRKEEKIYEGEGHMLDPYLTKTAIKRWYVEGENTELLESRAVPGKLYAYYQTLYFLRSNWQHFFLGAGMGNFSSKLAVKMTGLGLQGNYPIKNVYVNQNFLQYHFYTTLYYLSKHVAEHSIVNLPNSTYNQIGGEYGVLGLIVFVLLYIGFLWKHRKKMVSGVFLSVFMLLFFGVDYWFESLSLTILFELLVFSEIFSVKKNEQ